MLGTIIALLFAAILLTAAFLPPLLRLPWIDGTRRLLRRPVRCPTTGARVSCLLERDTFAGRWSRVHRCSAFGSVGTLGCGQECLTALDAEPPRARNEAA